jgi:hypothetical protein
MASRLASAGQNQLNLPSCRPSEANLYIFPYQRLPTAAAAPRARRLVPQNSSSITSGARPVDFII